MTSSAPSGLPKAQKIHSMFRGAAELMKCLRRIALLLELLAAGLSACGVVHGSVRWGGWGAFLILFLLLFAVFLRIWSRSIQSYSERCRRISARAFSQGNDVHPLVSSELDDAPPFIEHFAKNLPAQKQQEYYEPTFPPGAARLKEMYAHASFYSWQLLRTSGQLYITLSLLLALAGLAAIYWTAIEQPSSTTAVRVLEIVSTLVLASFAVRSADTGVASLRASCDARHIASKLLDTSNEAQLSELIAEYDIERAGGPPVPTLVYRFQRTALERKWMRRREALDELS